MSVDARHNVLVLFADEHDPRVTGMVGHPMVQTPNLDALARRGTRFTNAYTPSPVCVPARAGLATGRWVHDIGYWDNAMGYDGREPGWGHTLQAAGIRVESIGKLHYRRADDPTGFDRQHEPMHLAEGVGQVWGSVRDPMPEVFGPSPLYREIGAGESAYNRYDIRSAATTVAWLEARAREAASEPWVLFVGFVAPHFPLVVPQRFLDHYPREAVPWPKLQPSEGYRQHPWVAAQRRHCDHDAAIGTDERRRLAIASYFGLVSFMDALVGDIVTALERTGLAETTRLIYSADHGDNLGARGRYKYHHYVGYAPELFDLAADPEELHDLAGDPAHAQVLREYEAQLRSMLDPEAVDRRAKDDQNALIARVGGRERALQRGPRGATPAPGTPRDLPPTHR